MDFGGQLCSKWQSRLLRWSLLGISWTTYLLYRSLVIGQIEYDRDSETMVIRPRNILTKRFALILKAFLLYLDNFGIHYIIMTIYPFLPRQYDPDLQNKYLQIVVETVAFQISIWNVARIVYWLHSLSRNRSLVGLVNEVICVASLVEGTLGALPLEGNFLLIIYLIQLELTLLQLISYIRESLHLFFLSVILLEMFFNAFVAYLLLVLSCLTLFNRFFESHYMMGLPTRQQRQKILQLLHLYSRINNGHQDIIVVWLPVAGMLFSSVVMMVCHWAVIFYIVLFNHDLDAVGKWNAIVQGHLGGSLAPFLRILLIGLCNDRLAQLERFLNLQLLVIDLRHSGSGQRENCFAREFTNLQTCFDILLRSRPLRSPIMGEHHVCDSSLVMQFGFCVLVNALSYVQYGISSGTNLFNFHQASFNLEYHNIKN